VLREPAAGAGNPPAGVPAVPTARTAHGVRPGVAAELQHPRLRGDLQPRTAGRRRLLQLPKGVGNWWEKDVIMRRVGQNLYLLENGVPVSM
jgi:hypothetical protein